jgi:hypothetical protein
LLFHVGFQPIVSLCSLCSDFPDVSSSKIFIAVLIFSLPTSDRMRLNLFLYILMTRESVHLSTLLCFPLISAHLILDELFLSVLLTWVSGSSPLQAVLSTFRSLLLLTPPLVLVKGCHVVLMLCKPLWKRETSGF